MPMPLRLLHPHCSKNWGFQVGTKIAFSRHCQLTTLFIAPELGNIFSAFGAGLCAGVYIYQTTFKKAVWLIK